MIVKHRRLQIALALTVTVGFLSACAQELSANELEPSIVQALSGQQIYVESVDCPGPLVGEPGETLNCSVSGGADAQGAVVTEVRVVVTSVDGKDIRYRLEPIAASGR
ncbi:DUF4333 domain-containing protein [Ornithinimicrobium sp. Arc0846-15]|nr:DUF4333 domain-containing protein [Ornithinimicrobium laminariae]